MVQVLILFKRCKVHPATWLRELGDNTKSKTEMWYDIDRKMGEMWGPECLWTPVTADIIIRISSEQEYEQEIL